MNDVWSDWWEEEHGTQQEEVEVSEDDSMGEDISVEWN